METGAVRSDGLRLSHRWLRSILEAFGTLSETSNLACLNGGLKHVLFFHILGISSSQLTNPYCSKGVETSTTNQIHRLSYPQIIQILTIYKP